MVMELCRLNQTPRSEKGEKDRENEFLRFIEFPGFQSEFR